MIITIGQFVEAKQPNIHRALTCWIEQGAEAAGQYQAARRTVIGHFRFGTIRRIMQEPPRPGVGGLLPGEYAV